MHTIIYFLSIQTPLPPPSPKKQQQTNNKPHMQTVTDFCEENTLRWIVSSAYKKNDGKLFGGYFMDGISNAVDAMSLER